KRRRGHRLAGHPAARRLLAGPGTALSHRRARHRRTPRRTASAARGGPRPAAGDRPGRHRDGHRHDHRAAFDLLLLAARELPRICADRMSRYGFHEPPSQPDPRKGLQAMQISELIQRPAPSLRGLAAAWIGSRRALVITGVVVVFGGLALGWKWLA